jgi:Ca-activated chloride channel family protein
MMRESRGVRTLLASALLLFAVPVGYAAERAAVVLTGTVRSDAGAPLAQAQVYIQELTISVATDGAGRYRIVVPERHRGTAVMLRARAIGYAPQVARIELVRDTIVTDLVLRRDINRLQEVTVTKGAAAASLYGGGVQTRVPFAIGRVTASELPVANPDPGRDLSGEDYARIVDNPFRPPRVAPLSTFGVDVDRASYANVRRIITVDRQHPPADAVRIEEFLNYFPYDYDAPEGRHPFNVQTDVTRAPWAPEHLLVRIGLQARRIDLESAPANNLVFLIDVSGSMGTPDKLPLLKQAFGMLVDQLREQDRVAIVVYASSEGLALPSTSGADKPTLHGVIGMLEAGGSTAGGAGIRLAYDVAKKHHIRGGNNRVILATDGDFNVGITGAGELERYIEARRTEGTALTVLGFGAGNLKDARMEMLADKGNGNYHYIDSALEAKKVLVEEMGGTLVTVAKDVKLQVEFNPAVVAGYRLIGYENRVLATEDFKDDRKDAGDMGAGHSVTALYEIIPAGASDAADVPLPDSLRYTRRDRVTTSDTREVMFVRLRYKPPTDSVSIPMEVAVPNRVAEASDDFRFAQAVTAFGMVLRDSKHKGTATTALALQLAEGAIGEDRGGYRADFVRLVRDYQRLPKAVTAKQDRER